ncbi:hypothetical protein L2E82_53249 [Cichorium intybus]|nr:hypothetical protein L2E82_53249 [Cichorium intybus]
MDIIHETIEVQVDHKKFTVRIQEVENTVFIPVEESLEIKEVGEEQGEENSDSSEEDFPEASHEDSPFISDDEVDGDFDEAIIRESSPEMEYSNDKREETIKKINASFKKLSDQTHDAEFYNNKDCADHVDGEFYNNNDCAEHVEGGMLGRQKEKKSSPSHIKSAPTVDVNKLCNAEKTTQTLNNPIEESGSSINNSATSQVKDTFTPSNKKGFGRRREGLSGKELF